MHQATEATAAVCNRRILQKKRQRGDHGRLPLYVVSLRGGAELFKVLASCGCALSQKHSLVDDPNT